MSIMISTSDTGSHLLCCSAHPLLIHATGGVVVILYEYLITLGLEVQLFWGREITGASILFFINRYTMLFDALFYLWGYLPFTNTVSVSGIMLNLSNHHSLNP